MAFGRGVSLLICGTVCILGAVALQFYVAHLSGSSHAEIVRTGKHQDFTWQSPDSVLLTTVGAGIVGVGLIAAGVLAYFRRPGASVDIRQSR